MPLGPSSNGQELVSGNITFAVSGPLTHHSEYQFDAFLEVPGVEIPSDSGAGFPGVYWYPTYGQQGLHRICDAS